MSDLRRDYFVTRLIDQADSAALDELLCETMHRARETFLKEGIAEQKITMQPQVRCRYQNQEFAVEVPVAPGAFGPEQMQKLIADFHVIYEREYSYKLDAQVDIVGLHLIASADIGKLEIVPLPVTGASVTAAIKGRRLVDYATEGIHEATIYDGEKLEPGIQFTGPAIIEDPGTTIVIHPGNRVSLDAYGNTHIETRK